MHLRMDTQLKLQCLTQKQEGIAPAVVSVMDYGGGGGRVAKGMEGEG